MKSAAARISLVSSLLVTFVLSLSIWNLNRFFAPPKIENRVLGTEVDLTQEKKYWQEITRLNPTYRDGFIQLAKIECELQEAEACKNDLERARALDPNYAGLPSFAELVSGAASPSGF